ncbi:hypothetical protein ACFE04_022738 [Oxalis oulophora]
MDCDATPYELIARAITLVPLSDYLVLCVVLISVIVYNFLEIHFVRDLISGFSGDPVTLTCTSCSDVYQSIASKCQTLHGRYFPTVWLPSPHLQTAFLTIFGNAPRFSYKRHLFRTVDGGTIALDWLLHSDVSSKDGSRINETAPENDKTPIMILIPGLTSDSAAAYVKHMVFKMAKEGWNVVVSNHRGLAGVSLTSDCFYNAGWTEDIRKVIDFIHHKYPEAPLFVVGTSIGANVLVKYLGEVGVNTPITGAAAVCNPWDLLVCDRFINRRLAQKFYNKALTIGLQGYANLHQSILTRLADWEGIIKSRSVRDFDSCATCIVGNFETVDTYYRHSSSATYVKNVSIPLLCISALDDPLCTREAIPVDECRWVRAVSEWFTVLHSTPCIKKNKKPSVVSQIAGSSAPIQSVSSINEAPYVNVTQDGMVTAMSDMKTDNILEEVTNDQITVTEEVEEEILDTENSDMVVKPNKPMEPPSSPKQNNDSSIVPVKSIIQRISQHSRVSMWLLAYIAIVTTWPVVGSSLLLFLTKRFKRIVPSSLLGR